MNTTYILNNVRNLAKDGKHIEAIKALRDELKCGLGAAKRIVDMFVGRTCDWSHETSTEALAALLTHLTGDATIQANHPCQSADHVSDEQVAAINDAVKALSRIRGNLDRINATKYILNRFSNGGF